MDRLVDVYPYRKRNDEVLFLIFKRAEDVIYAGQWRMIGGKAQGKETYPEAALREMKEETGIIPESFWTLPSLNQFYDHYNDCICQIPAFAAQIGSGSDIILNHEHINQKWISQEEIDDYIQWPEQKRLMNLLANIVQQNQIIDEWIIEV